MAEPADIIERMRLAQIAYEGADEEFKLPIWRNIESIRAELRQTSPAERRYWTAHLKDVRGNNGVVRPHYMTVDVDLGVGYLPDRRATLNPAS